MDVEDFHDAEADSQFALLRTETGALNAARLKVSPQ